MVHNLRILASEKLIIFIRRRTLQCVKHAHTYAPTTTHPPIDPPSHPRTQPSTHRPTCPPTHPPHPRTQPTHPPTHPPIPVLNPPTRAPTYPPTLPYAQHTAICSIKGRVRMNDAADHGYLAFGLVWTSTPTTVLTSLYMFLCLCLSTVLALCTYPRMNRGAGALH